VKPPIKSSFVDGDAGEKIGDGDEGIDLKEELVETKADCSNPSGR